MREYVSQGNKISGSKRLNSSWMVNFESNRRRSLASNVQSAVCRAVIAGELVY
jgi:hypothetical protein